MNNLEKMISKRDSYYDAIDDWFEEFEAAKAVDDKDQMGYALSMIQHFDKLADAIDEKINAHELALAEAKARKIREEAERIEKRICNRTDLVKSVITATIPAVTYGILTSLIVKKDSEEPITGKAKWGIFSNMNSKMNK